MVTLFIRYAADIFHVISNFQIEKSKFDGKFDKLNIKFWTPHGLWGCFSNSKDPWSLVGPGCHQVSSGVVVGIIEGKLRVEALLNTAPYHPTQDIEDTSTAVYHIAQP